MKKRVGILTSGGDCPGLNATIRGVAKALYARMGDNVEIVGIANGYSGLINGDYREMNEDDFRGILTLGGTWSGRTGSRSRTGSGRGTVSPTPSTGRAWSCRTVWRGFRRRTV